jgi:hypothetical protein
MLTRKRIIAKAQFVEEGEKLLIAKTSVGQN